MEKNFAGFSTASGRNVALKPELLSEMQNKYSIILNTEAESLNDELFDAELKLKRNAATTTANKRKNPSTHHYHSDTTAAHLVNKKSKILHSGDCGDLENSTEKKARLNELLERKNAAHIIFSKHLQVGRVEGFQTASGRTVQIRPESVKLARKIISDSFGTECEDGGENSTSENAKYMEEKEQNVPIAYSNSSERIRNLLMGNEEEKEEDGGGFGGDDDDGGGGGGGGGRSSANVKIEGAAFRTARGKTLATRHDSLVFAEHLLRGISADEFKENGNVIRGLTENSAAEESNNLSANEGGVISLDQEIADSTLALLYDIKNNEDDSFSVGKKRTVFHKKPASAVRLPSQETERDDGGGGGGGGGGGSGSGSGSCSSSPILKGNFDKAKITRKSRIHVRKLISGSGGGGTTGKTTAVLFPSAGNVENTGAVVLMSSEKKSFNFQKRNIWEEGGEREAIKQQNYIMNKPDGDCKPRIGFYMSQFHTLNAFRRMTLRQAFPNENPNRYSQSEMLKMGMKQCVVDINSENAGNFLFTQDFFSAEERKKTAKAIIFADNVRLILNKEGTCSFNEMCRGFLASPGVSPKLISVEWIRNHYRWIIWKLASMEKSFPHYFGGRYLTPENVLYQLKFRYDKEIDKCERSALKKIIECDENPARPLILCVAAISVIPDSINEYELELTDGWYSIFSQIDVEMNKLISRRKVTVGTKLIVCNAQLVGCTDGHDPLQLDRSVRLKICTNAVRRVLWHTKLGFYWKKQTPIQRIQSLLPHGGSVPHLLATIVRVYPILYFKKKDNGSIAFHSEKAEADQLTRFEKERQKCVENLLSQVTREVFRDNNLNEDDVKINTDFYASQSAYSSSQLQNKNNVYSKLEEAIKNKMETMLPEQYRKKTESSSPVLKVRLSDHSTKSDIPPSAILTIWHPSEDILSSMKEGKVCNFFNTVATGFRNGEFHLKANRLTKYELLAAADSQQLFQFDRRICMVKELVAKKAAILFDEVDIIGVVVKKDSSNSSTPNRTIFLADLEKNIFAISFENSDFEDTFEEKNLVSCVNLRWKKGFLYWKIPLLFASECSSFSCRTTRNLKHMENSFREFSQYFTANDISLFVAECEQELSTIQSASPVHCDIIPSSSSSSVISRQKNENEFFIYEEHSFNSKIILSKVKQLDSFGEAPSLAPICLLNGLRSGRKISINATHKFT